MIISMEHRFIFVHVPKTGGDSITRALLPFARPQERTLLKSLRRRIPIKDSPERIYLRKHDPASRAIARLGKDVYDSFRSFAVVRNPFDHAVSHYEFMKQFRIPKVAKKVGEMTFAEYLEYRMKPPFWNDTFFARLPNQSFFVANEGKLVVDRLIKFENLAEDFASVTAEIGLGDIKLPHINKTKSKSKQRAYQDYFDAQSMKLALKLYSDDFDLLGYSRELS